MIKSNLSKEYLNSIKEQIIDQQAKQLISDLDWVRLKGVSKSKSDLFPIVFSGEGEKILLLHGFDSCFLEFRRLTPLLKGKYKLIIPDLFGFGFCPRNKENKYGFKYIMEHLNSVLEFLPDDKPIGLIGASMGGALALELARQNPTKINKVLLLSPAGLSRENPKIPWPLNHLGALFLRQPFIRKGLCKQAFSNPKIDVGPAEEQIASIHLEVPGWQSSLAAFALDGGVYNCGQPKPVQPIKILMGKNDRIIPKGEKEDTKKLYKENIEIAFNSGHLPHLEEPKLVASHWINFE